MKAAVVTSFDAPPRYREHPSPKASGASELLVDVIASGLHPRVRSQANGSHYTSTDQLPLVPGIDGVGRDAEGRLRYFVLPDTNMGAMAEKTVIDARRSVVLPDGSDAIAVAAAMNPAMSSWVALRRRIAFERGQSVLVLGATGSAGRLAIQVACHFGAGRIVAAGRDAARLAKVGATEEILYDDIAKAADVDVVLDYVWGEVAMNAMVSLVKARADRGQPLSWIQIGSMAGATAAIPSAALRAARLSIMGSGQGSVSTRDIVAELPEIAAAITNGTFDVDARAVPLADVTAAWTEPATSFERLVIAP